MKWMIIPAALLSGLVLAAPSAQPSAAAAEHPPDPIAITHVAIIDTQGGPTQPDMTVLIRDGRIAAVEPADATCT